MIKAANPPAWADAITEQFCDTITRAAKKYDLPMPLLDKQCVLPASKLLGEGLYGAAYLTSEDDCVFKITTDSTEAHFAATAIKLRKEKGVDPAGIVDIRAVFAIPAQRDDDPLFFIWREKAKTMGLPEKSASCEMKAFGEILSKFYKASDKAFRIALEEQQTNTNYFAWLKDRVDLSNAMLAGKKIPVSSKFSELLADCYEFCDQLMASGHDSFYVGDALRTYMHSGILLCDVHAGNVGVVERGRCGSRQWVLVDNGHAMVLKKELSEIGVPVLAETYRPEKRNGA